MPGKRPRPIRRTTSLSQLSCRLDPSSNLEQRLAPPAPSGLASQHLTHSLNPSPDLMSLGMDGLAANSIARPESKLEASGVSPVNAPDDETMGVNTDESSGDCIKMQTGSSTISVEDLDLQNMAIDSVNDSHSSSRPDRSDRRVRSGHSPSDIPSGSSPIHSRPEPSESIRPVDFLDICFYCKRRLRLGRDIFMYRGDRAFCSIECRYNQMAADDLKEKCAASATRKGSTSSAVPSNASSHVGPAETAAAA